MKFMLDTNIVIYLMRNRPPEVRERITALNDDDTVCMSFVTFAELLKGAEGSSRRTDVRRRLATLIEQIPVEYTVTVRTCEHYAAHSSRLRRLGKPIGGNDLWIAAHALSHGATLVTNNRAEFDRIEGLTVENWV